MPVAQCSPRKRLRRNPSATECHSQPLLGGRTLLHRDIGHLARIDLAPLPRLRHWREARGFTQEELADRIGMRRNAIWRIEAGYETRARTARSLARALFVELDELLA